MSRTNLSKHLHGLLILVFVICLFPVFPLVAEGQTVNLTGTWNSNGFTTGPSAPWWGRGTVTVASNGTLTFSGTESNGSAYSGSGAFSIASTGIVMTVNGQSESFLCQTDSDNTVVVCAETWPDGSSNLLILTNQAASYSLADLAGNWEGNFLSSGPTSAWTRVSETINPDGTFTGSSTSSDGSSGSISGTLSISSDGVITCVSGSCVDPTYVSFMDAGKTIMVGTSGAATTAEDATLFVFTKQAASYSLADLVGTWQGDGLVSGPEAPLWENDTLAISTNGTSAFSWTVSSGSSGAGSGTVSISSGGTITVNPDTLSSTSTGVIDANMTVMVFTDTLPDGATQEIKIFTNNALVVPDEAPIVAPSSSYAQPTVSSTPATVASTPATGGLAAPASNSGAPVTSNTSPSSHGGTAAQAGGSPIKESSPTNSAANAPVTATNPIETSPTPSPSNSSVPAAVPDAPTMVGATPGYAQATAGNAQATVSFKLPTNGGGQITGCTVTSNPGGVTSTGAGSPILVSGLTNGTAYTFTVTATNKVGTGPPSSASNSLTPTTVPDAPTIVAAKAGNARVKVSFKAPASNGGSRITSYTVTSSAGQTASGRASPITVKGLTKGTACTFTVTATNKIGTGPPSSASKSVMPR
ncbi:MAG: fibronectin type III domain-containing protein [Syntrophobacteraceae bacterium]